MQVNARVCLVAAALLCLSQSGASASARVKRQGWQWQPDPDDQFPAIPVSEVPQEAVTSPRPGRPGTTVTTTTTASPQYRSCLSSCRTTPEYNPVCGTDGVTYDSAARLNCARRCGTNVQVSFIGRCEAL